MGFGSSIGVQSAVKFNGYRTPFFHLTCGVIQGCLFFLCYMYYMPKSSLVTIALILILLVCLFLVLLLCYLLCLSIVIVTTNDSIKAVFDTYSVFEHGFGSKLNLSKSKC